ncbi:membrane protein of unknown function [Modestobacter italicus]|uniref:Uncharacterized protein n=1 Tax=Modestobacter italicus (strain DSM 44449 / CECT 9708 / BC 501) TaxID=2732864 RepID=I4EVK0_MODI5|nr:hypothetical protein [Modestobacter marinus]CCH87413.1 membrane protein of unknown function [Modestobacter marinus]
MSDAFLLSLAGISATLLGTFTLGVFFYLDSSRHHERGTGAAADRYMRSGARWVFAAYSLPLFVPLVVAGVGPRWAAASFALLGTALVAATVDTSRRITAKGATHMSPSVTVNEIATTVLVLLLVALPWAAGGWLPRPSAFVPSLLIALVAAFTSTATFVMYSFDRADDEAADTAERRSTEAG